MDGPGFEIDVVALFVALLTQLLLVVTPTGPVLAVLCFLGTLSAKTRTDRLALELSCTGLLFCLLGCLVFRSWLIWVFMGGTSISCVSVWLCLKVRLRI